MKLFITSKIYDTEKQTIAEIEKAVQEDLDAFIGKDKVEFKLYTLGNVVAMFFNRHLDYSSLRADPRESIIGEDALIITGDRYNGFIMPSPLPPMPYLGYIIYNLEQSDFLAYIIHSGFISGYQNRYGDNLKPPTNVYHRMTA